MLLKKSSGPICKGVSCGWAKVKQGVTTVEEVARVTQEDEELSGT